MMYHPFPRWPQWRAAAAGVLALALCPAPAAAFDVKVISDASVTFLDPSDASPDAVFPFEVQADGSRLHTITIDMPLSYRQCRVDYRRSNTVKVRWVPPAAFSDFADDHYDIILSIIEPSEPEEDDVTIVFTTPAGFTRSLLDQYEKRQPGDGIASVEAFFTTALLARHFAFALPDGAGKTRRMVNASVDHLAEANTLFGSVNVQPGWEYERFVMENAGSGNRADLTLRSLQGMNIAFFRDIRLAFRDVLNGSAEDCDRGLKVLRELSRCYDDISAQAPNLLPDVANVLKSNDPDLTGTAGFNFGRRVAEAEAICATKRGD